MTGGAAEAGHERLDHGGVEARRVGGGQVLGAEHDGAGGLRDARLGQPHQFGDDPVADVLQIGGALSHEPPDLLELDDELVDGLRRGLLGLLAAVDELGRRANPAAVAGQGRRGTQHLGGDAGGRTGAVGEPSRDRLGGGLEAIHLGRPGVLGDVSPARRRNVRRASPGGGCVGVTADHSGATHSLFLHCFFLCVAGR